MKLKHSSEGAGEDNLSDGVNEEQSLDGDSNEQPLGETVTADMIITTDVTIPETQPPTSSWANEWSDDDVTSFQPPKNIVAEVKQNGKQELSTQTKGNKLKKLKN